MSESRREIAEFGWGNLARLSVFAVTLAAAVTMVVIIETIDPFLTGTVVLMLASLWLIRRGGRAGPIMLLISTVLFLGFGGFFFVLAFSVPQSSLELMVNSIFLVAGLLALLSGIGMIRNPDDPPSRQARIFAVAGSAALFGLFAWAVAVKLTYDEPPVGSGDAQMAAEDKLFTKETLTVPAGHISIVIDNRDFGIHTFTVDELDVDEPLPGSVATEVEFQAEPGTYEFECKVSGHDKMKGTLIVE
jgi:plastocyanin